jgi:hypothetical protein
MGGNNSCGTSIPPLTLVTLLAELAMLGLTDTCPLLETRDIEVMVRAKNSNVLLKKQVCSLRLGLSRGPEEVCTVVFSMSIPSEVALENVAK